MFPISADTLTMSGVPSELVLPRHDDGYYGCLFGDCGAVLSGKPAAASHVRRKHLGIAIGCRHCNKRYYKPGGWGDHMKKQAPKLAPCPVVCRPRFGEPSSVVDEPDPMPPPLK